MPTLEEFTAAARAEIEAKKTSNGGDGIYKLVNKVRSEFDDVDYEIAITDKANKDFADQEYGYKQDRHEAYGSIADQLDMMYWDNVNGTTTWKDHIAKVKSDYPKPS
jgi:hypothetical protein